MAKNALIVFAKNERLGYVKTRLAADIGDEAALKIYRKLIQITISACINLEADIFIFYSDQIVENDGWNAINAIKKVQVSGDLGNRMSEALISLDEEYQHKIIIGTDCPNLTTEILTKAFRALEKNEFTIGPANDGGYYLLGMNNYFPPIFLDVPWSSSSVFETTISKLTKGDHSYHILPELIDIDNIGDLKLSGFNLE